VIVGQIIGVDPQLNSGPLQNAEVSLSGTSFSTRSDAMGQYKLGNVPLGYYRIFCVHRGHWSDQDLIKVVTDTVRMDFNLMPDVPQGSCWEPIVKFAGEITDITSGKAIPNAYLCTNFHLGGCDRYHTWADSTGIYVWRLSVEPEDVTITAAGYQPLQVVVQANPPDPGLRTHVMNFALTPISNETTQTSAFLPDGSLMYSFANSPDYKKVPVPLSFLDIQVMEKTENKPLPYAYIWVYELRQGARTDQNGKFLIGPIEPGTYTATAMKYDYFVPREYQHFIADVPKPKSSNSISTAKLVLWMMQQP
jgi:hypothetical protein